MRYRHELKYSISESERVSLVARMSSLIAHDAHAGPTGFYKIRSLYFDDYFKTAYSDKISGVDNRAKYRIRFYNESDAVIRLERKLKNGSYIFKESAPLTRDECNSIINGDCGFLLRRKESLCAEFYYVYVAKILRPQVIVDYVREPFVLKAGDVRITFDSDVRALPGDFPLFLQGQRGALAVEPGTLILEVKFTELLPRYVKAILPRQGLQLEAFSKYTECCDALTPAAIPVD